MSKELNAGSLRASIRDVARARTRVDDALAYALRGIGVGTAYQKLSEARKALDDEHSKLLAMRERMDG